MVVTEDLEQYKIFWTKFLKEYGRDIKTVAIHSPSQEYSLYTEIFKKKNIYNLNKKNWNLNEEIKVTTTSITELRGSTLIDQLAIKSPELIHSTI